jgi:hypothetical protein
MKVPIRFNPKKPSMSVPVSREPCDTPPAA